MHRRTFLSQTAKTTAATAATLHSNVRLPPALLLPASEFVPVSSALEAVPQVY